MNEFINPDTGRNYDFKEMPPGKKIIFVNEICNTRSDFETSMVHIAEISGFNIQGVFCPTFGFSTDAICYVNSIARDAAYEGAREIQRNIKEFYESSAPGASMWL